MGILGFYVFSLIVLVVGFMIVKKVATCMIKTVVSIIVLALVQFRFWLSFETL